MNGQRLLLALTALNVGLSRLGGAPHAAPSFARQPASVSGLPAGTSAAGVAYPETVLLRLITEHGLRP